MFFSVFRNSFVIFEVKSEFNSLEENDQVKQKNENSNEGKIPRKDSARKTSIEVSQNVPTPIMNNLYSQG